MCHREKQNVYFVNQLYFRNKFLRICLKKIHVRLRMSVAENKNNLIFCFAIMLDYIYKLHVFYHYARLYL